MINTYKKLSLMILGAIISCLTLMAREVTSFNDGWEFKRGPFSTDVYKAQEIWKGKWTKVNIPHTWNNKDMQTEYNKFYQGAAYYRKTYFAREDLKGKRVFLRFEGVGDCSEVYVNGALVGTHKGGYSAFVVEIGDELQLGKNNEIVAKADNQSRPDVIPVNHVLFGVYGGIYRPITMIVTDSCNISVNDFASSGVYITQKNVSAKSADISVKVKLDNGGLHPASLVLENRIFSKDGKQIACNKQKISLTTQGTQSFVSNFKISHPHLWQGRQNPYLYKVESVLLQDGRIIDSVVQPLGIRHFELIAGKGFYLNGKKYPMYGVTRHQDWWGLGSALQNENHDFDLATIMDVGATTVRFAHYQQSEYLYSKCDSLGLIIWAEIPFVNQVTGQEAENALNQLRELIRQNFNHPSIYVWGLHNEVYRPHAYTAQLTAMLHNTAKTEDPDRYTVSVNGYGRMNHPVNLNADIQGMNRYFGWYEGEIKDIRKWIENLEKDYPTQKFILSEYGADGNTNQQTEYLGESQDWTKPYYPETYETKIHEYQWSIIAKHPYILASYLWNTFDFATPMANRGGVPARNMKGLVTFDRKTRKDAYYWYKANWSKSPVLHITQRRNINREKKITEVTVYSNMGTPKLTVNGKEISGMKKGYTDVHYIFDKVNLSDGKNSIKAEVRVNGKLYEDQIEWIYSGEQNRGSDNSYNKNEHGGL